MDISIPIYVESRYRVNRKKIKERVEDTVRAGGVVGSCEVSVAIIGNRKMRALNKKYREIDKPTNVLSFSQLEGKTQIIPSDALILGDVVVSYPMVLEEAAAQNMLVDDKICELIEHGVKHLLGQHH